MKNKNVLTYFTNDTEMMEHIFNASGENEKWIKSIIFATHIYLLKTEFALNPQVQDVFAVGVYIYSLMTENSKHWPPN